MYFHGRNRVNFGRNRPDRPILIEIGKISVNTTSILVEFRVICRKFDVEKLGQENMSLWPRVKIVMILESLLMEHLNILKYFKPWK